MQEVIEGLVARPDLAAWLLEGAWATEFDKATLSRAKEYANESSVTKVEWLDLSGSGELIITASVKGSQRRPYEAALILRESRKLWYFETECSCPVGDQCKHSAAIFLLIQRQVQNRTAGAGAASSQPDPSLQLWLNEIDKATQASASVEQPAKAAKQNRFLAYCIEDPADGHQRKLVVNLRVGTLQKDGTVRMQGGAATADPTNPPKYMAQEDIPLAARYRQLVRKYGDWGSLQLKGPGWDEFLDGAMATGRLYFGREHNDYFGSSDHRCLSAGDPETFEGAWENLPDGSARPILRSSRPGLTLIPTEPPRYLDREKALTGPVKSNLPPAVMAAWSRGPLIPAAQVPGLIERFSTVRGLELPTPVKLETEVRPIGPPQPHLRIRKKTFSNSWQSLDLIIGELSIRYGDSPLLTPLTNNAPREHIALRDGKRVIWKRDFKAERAAERALLSEEVVHLKNLIPGNLLDSSTFHAVTIHEPSPTEEIAWIELLEGPEFAQLRADGWIIEVDPECHLTTRDVTDFVPDLLTESDHGIDWFRFDVTYEIDGSRISMIPVIAHAITLNFPPADSPDLPEFMLVPCENPEDGFIRFPAKQVMELVDQVRHLFLGRTDDGPLRLDRLAAAGMADHLAIDASETTRALARLSHRLRDIQELPEVKVPSSVQASLRPYQQEGYRWLQFLAENGLHGILADDMGLGKTLQTLTHLAAEHAKKPGKPSLVIAPTSVVPNWAAEAEKFTPDLKILTLHGPNRSAEFGAIPEADVVFTSYPLLARDFDQLSRHEWHVLALDEAQHIKNPKAITAQSACKLQASHRLCLSGTPMENHLGELWSLMRFLMPGFLLDEKTFNSRLRRPIERDRSADAQQALNRRVAPLILRRTKDQVATELPAKTEMIHGIDLNKKQADLYESVRATMDQRVRDAIAENGLAKSHIIVLDALLKLRQICCHPQLLKSAAAKNATDSAKLDYLTGELLPTLIEEGRRILLFSQFTSMLTLIEDHLVKQEIPFLKLTGDTRDRASLVKTFQSGKIPIFLISLKAGGTGLNLTAADTVIHYDPWWNPAAENQATDRAHRIGQTKPVFVHKLVCRGTIEDRILELQKHKSALVEALLSEETSKLKLDEKTLSHLLAPLT